MTCLCFCIGKPAFAVTPPTISPGTGPYATQQNVTLSAPGFEIFFTTDGTVPTTASQQFNSGDVIPVTTPTQINAVAYDPGTSTYSNVTTAWINADPVLRPLLGFTFSPALFLQSDFGLVTSGVGSPSPVTNWIDFSLTGASAANSTATAPLLAAISAGRSVVRFNGSSNLALSIPNLGNGYTGATFFVVTRPNALTAGSRIIDFGQGVSGNNVLMRISNSGSTGLYSTFNGTTESSVSSASALSQGQFQLLEASQAQASPYSATFLVNGTPGTTASINMPPAVLRSSNFLGQSSSGGNGYTGDIAEVLVYYGTINSNTQLTASQAAVVRSILLQKYQLLTQVPTTPIFSVPTGTLLQPAQVAISTEGGTATYVTTDGSIPTVNPALLNSGQPLQINFSQTVKAIAVRNGVTSAVATATYTLDSNQFPAPSGADMTTPSIQIDLPSPSI